MPKKARPAFTMIELLVVLGILSILLVIAVPSVTKMQDNLRMRTLADDIDRDLRWLQSEAMNHHAAGQFVILDNGRRYRMYLIIDEEPRRTLADRRVHDKHRLRHSAKTNTPVEFSKGGTANTFYTIFVTQNDVNRIAIIPYSTGRIRTEWVGT